MIVMLLILFAQAEPNARTTPAEVSPRTKAILARLDEPIPMEFPKATQLDEVLPYIKRSAQKGPNPPGIPIYIDPLGLQEVQRSLNSTVAIRVKGSPLMEQPDGRRVRFESRDRFPRQDPRPASAQYRVDIAVEGVIRVAANQPTE